MHNVNKRTQCENEKLTLHAISDATKALNRRILTETNFIPKKKTANIH